MADLSYTITPKSDQLNADDLIGANKTLVITDVSASNSPDQPVSIHYQGGDGRPYKPCKSMRRVLIHAWGSESDNWIGKAMVVYRDESVTWAGQAVGGIRISHLSHIDGPITISLTATRGKRKKTTIQKLDFQGGGDDLQKYRDALSLSVAGGIDALKQAWASIPSGARSKLAGFKDQCKAQIEAQQQPQPEPQVQGFTPVQAEEKPQQRPQDPQPQEQGAAIDPSEL